MRRREFIGGLIFAPFATQSSAAEKRISILHSGPIHVLIDALRALGLENGSTAVIEVLGGEGDAGRLDALVNGIAARKPDVTIALTSPAVHCVEKGRCDDAGCLHVCDRSGRAWNRRQCGKARW